MEMPMIRLFSAPFASIALLLAPATAFAHDGYEWIMHEPRYVDRVGIHCCSTDCVPAEAARFNEDGDGIIFDGAERLSHRERGIYWSREPNPPESQRWWVCRRHNKLRCIFRPQPDS
jgi:hypothetical protein